jgi:signal transduction histidine kinase
MTSLFFVLRITAAWFFTLLCVVAGLTELVGAYQGPHWSVLVACLVLLLFVVTSAFSHLRRVRLIANRIDLSTISNRQRRQIELPLEAGEAFDLVDAAVRELPGVEFIESARDSLQVRAKLKRIEPYGAVPRWSLARLIGPWRNQLLATVTPGEDSGSLALICEPEGAAWSDWFRVDGGTNLENAEAISRAISRRLAERRRNERDQVRQSHTEKELTVAKLSLLHAQVEPHFLYNTLASAQYLTRTDPPRADEMLGNLITYLRHSLPRTDDSLSSLGEELERARAYLEILKIRMGPRLELQIEVPGELRPLPFPAMMLQTLVENAIKHGLEPKPGGGTIWILARMGDAGLAVTVADDGQGFSDQGAGSGVGLANIRERLRLAYGAAARFSIVANFPAGVAATISLPVGPESAHA